MVELSDVALEELRSRSETLTLHDPVRIVETYHPNDRPGVARDARRLPRSARLRVRRGRG